MTDAERVTLVARAGFTERQASFLVTVALHSGVCLSRHYCDFAGLVWGRKTRAFFDHLIERGWATANPCARRGARIFHVQHKVLYRLIGEPDSRLRRPVPLGRAVERLMLLDAVLADREHAWLGTERDKVEHFTRVTGLKAQYLPQATFGETPAITRYFPERLPIGWHRDGRPHVFLYLPRRWDPIDFRLFLQRHAELLRALADWEIRLVLAPHLADAESTYRKACWNELATPIAPHLVEELRWYFGRLRRAAEDPIDPHEPRYKAAHAAFAAPRFRALYRTWQQVGNDVLETQDSALLREALQRQTGRVTAHVLHHQYHHLVRLVGTV